MFFQTSDKIPTQSDLDSLFERIREDYNLMTDDDFYHLAVLVNSKFINHDIIIQQLSKEDLIHKLDALTRALSHCKLEKKNKHYILSNLYKVKDGLDSSSRREWFHKKNLSICEEIHIRGVYVEFKFSIIDEQPTLLLRHRYGFNSITNLIELFLE